MESFTIKLRKVFNSYQEARIHEYKVLSRLKAPKNNRLLNQAVSSPRICSKDSESEKIRRKKISTSMKKLWNTPEYSDNHPFNNASKEERIRVSKLGNKARQESLKRQYESGERRPYKRKYMKTEDFPIISITRNGEIKDIRKKPNIRL